MGLCINVAHTAYTIYKLYRFPILRVIVYLGLLINISEATQGCLTNVNILFWNVQNVRWCGNFLMADKTVICFLNANILLTFRSSLHEENRPHIHHPRVLFGALRHSKCDTYFLVSCPIWSSDARKLPGATALWSCTLKLIFLLSIFRGFFLSSFSKIPVLIALIFK